VYTGTHDNNTMAGWFAEETTDEDRQRICLYLGREVDPCAAGWEFVRLALASVANTAIVPMQDILGLGAEARMNTPSVAGGDNWRWRLCKDQLTGDLACRFAELTRLFGRA
jgi:4-alpha-glucanotransferase